MEWRGRATALVALRGRDLAAEARVWWNDYAEEPSTLARFFTDLAEGWRGWSGEKEWRALEHPFSLVATHDGLGHIALDVELASGFYPEDWWTKVRLLLDAGSLDEVADRVRKFVDAAPSDNRRGDAPAQAAAKGDDRS